MTIETGDVVRLKSGGPLMTTGTYSHGEGKFHCDWFNELDEHCAGLFLRASLTPNIKPGVLYRTRDVTTSYDMGGGVAVDVIEQDFETTLESSQVRSFFTFNVEGKDKLVCFPYLEYDEALHQIVDEEAAFGDLDMCMVSVIKTTHRQWGEEGSKPSGEFIRLRVQTSDKVRYIMTFCEDFACITACFFIPAIEIVNGGRCT